MDPPAPFHPTATRRVRQTVRVGVGVVVLSPDNRIYAGVRRNSHGAGQLALPGGHLELQESWEDCARREVREEMNVSLTTTTTTTSNDDCVEFLHVTNDPMPDEKKHYVTIFMLARTTQTPENMEPEKCEGWKAYSWQELRSFAAPDSGHTLFGPLLRLVKENPPVLQALVARAADTSAAQQVVAPPPVVEMPSHVDIEPTTAPVSMQVKTVEVEKVTAAMNRVAVDP